jgi:hypothetical protein
MAETLTVDETSFPNAKPHSALLIAYKAFADLAGKGSLFVITIVAARRLSANAFGVFALGSTLGWMVAVVTDGGIQLHLARAVARRPEQAATLLREWLRVRVWTTAIAITGVGVGLAVGRRGPSTAPIAILVLVYACSGLVELLHYFYRGLSRSEIESWLTLWQRGGTLACGLIALALTPDVTWLAIAMLAPVAATLAWSVRIASGMVGETHVGRVLSDPAHRRVQKDPPCITVRSLATFRRDIWPIGAGIVLSALYFRVDVFLVQLWSGTEAVAFYNAVFRLVKASTPGSYTFILPATKEVPRQLMHPRKKTVGVRIPEHVVAQALLAELGEPLLSSTLLLPDHEAPLTQGWEIKEELDTAVDAVVDSGDCGTEPTTVS